MPCRKEWVNGFKKFFQIHSRSLLVNIVTAQTEKEPTRARARANFPEVLFQRALDLVDRLDAAPELGNPLGALVGVAHQEGCPPLLLGIADVLQMQQFNSILYFISHRAVQF